VAVILASCPVGIFKSTGGGPFCEHLNAQEAIGGVLICCGLLSVTLSKHLEDKAPKKEALLSTYPGHTTQ